MSDDPKILTETELREMMREEFQPMEACLQRIDVALRGDTDGTPGLNQRVYSVESSRRTAHKLWSSVLAVIVSVFGALAAKVIGDGNTDKAREGRHYEQRIDQ